MADSTNLAVSNRHIDSLIAYVLDTKPYHTKLSEVVEEYLFNDAFTVNVVDGEMQTMAVLGLDYLKKSSSPLRKVWEKAPIRPDSSLSADRTFISDGARRAFGIAPILVNKLFSLSSQEKFVVDGSQSEIPGLSVEVISPRRFDGPGIPLVLRNDDALVESVDYHISHGAFSFRTNGGSTWQQHATSHLGVFPATSGALSYKSVNRHHGYITDISSNSALEMYEEWTLVWNEANQNLEVTGSSSGFIGTAEYGVPFVDSRINFTFTHSPGEVAELPASINDGDTFVLTPSAKITIHPDSVDETWTLIKVNPIALDGAPVFSGVSGPTPSLSVYTRSLERTGANTFTITFSSNTEFELSSTTPIAGYPKTGNVDKSFKDDFVHFTINRNGRTFTVGENFVFSVLERKANYLVYGNVSGWQPPAKIGEWYFNGKIGFKIPELDYFVCVNGNFLQNFHHVFEPILQPHSIAVPSKYSIIFRPPVLNEPDVRATVENNIYGYRRGLIPGETWSDEFCSFKIDGDIDAGENVTVYLAPKDLFTYIAGYDEAPYDRTPYDMVTAEIEFPVDLLQEYFPLYHSYGSVIIPSAIFEDEITVDKIERDFLRFKLGNSVGVIDGLGQNLGASLGGTPVTNESTVIPELGDNNTWVPLEFRHKDVDGNDVVFPDYVSKYEAYAASSPNTKIFEVRQPKNSLAVIEFVQSFFNEYLPQTTPFIFRTHQQSSYSQLIRIKISEQLYVESDIELNFQNGDGGDTSSAGFYEGLTITEYDSGEIAQKTTIFFQPNESPELKVDIEAEIYVITMPENHLYDEIQIVPDEGTPFTVVPTYYPYTHIPSATSEWAFSFIVPDGTGPFTMIVGEELPP